MRIAILSRNSQCYSTRRLVSACQIRQIAAEVIDHSRCYISVEKKNPAVYYKGHRIEGIGAVIPRIGASVTFYGTAVVRQFEMQGVFSVNESQAITRSRDKLRSMQLLARAGLSIPKTVFAQHLRDVRDIIQYVGGPPLIVKVLEGTQGVGVILADSYQAAQSTIEAFLGKNIYILVQEFVAEAAHTDIRALVVGGRVVAAMKRTTITNDFRANICRGGTGVQVSLTPDEEHSAILAAATLGLRIAGVDLVRTNRGPMILEVNSSPGLKGIEGATGIDVAGAIVDFAVHHAPVADVHDPIGY